MCLLHLPRSDEAKLSQSASALDREVHQLLRLPQAQGQGHDQARRGVSHFRANSPASAAAACRALEHEYVAVALKAVMAGLAYLLVLKEQRRIALVEGGGLRVVALVEGGGLRVVALVEGGGLRVVALVEGGGLRVVGMVGSVMVNLLYITPPYIQMSCGVVDRLML